jgi:signal transduction histidine kinase
VVERHHRFFAVAARKAVSLVEHVAFAVQSMKAIAVGKRLDVRLFVDLRLDVVQAEPTRLRKCGLNYLSNALRFTADGGGLTVDVRLEGSDAYSILVEDNGIGTRVEDLPPRFSAFGQLGASWRGAWDW